MGIFIRSKDLKMNDYAILFPNQEERHAPLNYDKTKELEASDFAKPIMEYLMSLFGGQNPGEFNSLGIGSFGDFHKICKEFDKTGTTSAPVAIKFQATSRMAQKIADHLSNVEVLDRKGRRVEPAAPSRHASRVAERRAAETSEHTR